MAVVASLMPLVAAPAQAADLSKFDPGNIIADAVFFNAGAMTQAQVQSFLQAKESSCAPSATCVKDYYTVTKSLAADAMCGAYSGGTSERASAIVYKVARACGINPQVLLVTMQKEQGLITSVWPSDWAYAHAMGADCPDTTGCNSITAGFFAQVYKSAWQLKRYANPPGTSSFFTWYAPGHTWNILYNPSTSCGSKAVYVKNQATADLYYYTPYTPNAAALAAGYGSGDSCSAYGNRNFYNYFTDWFGSTQGAPAPPPPPPPPPTPPPPVLSSLDRAGYVLGLDGSGTLWGYPISSKATWGSRVATATGLTGYKSVLSIGDLDGDGHNDSLAVTSTGIVRLLRGTGGTGFQAPRTLGISWSGARLYAAAGDANGDGVPDAYTIGTDNRLLLWPGNRSGGFGRPVPIAGDWSNVNLITGALDMSGDLLPDLVARKTTGELVLYLGDGKGGFSGSRTIGVGWSGMTAIFSPADVTGDGRPDILARDASGNLRLYPNTGGGTLTGGAVIGNGWQVMTSLSGPAAAPKGVRVRPAGVGDLTGDLAADVLATSSTGQLLLYPGNGHGGWGSRSVAVSSWGTARLVPLGDFTGDGYSDIGAIAPDGRFLLYRGNEAGGFAPPTAIGWGWSSFTSVFGGVDFDGDGNPDVIVRNPAGQLLLYRGSGTGGWGANLGAVIGTGWGGFTAIFPVGDFDGDRHADLLARAKDGSLLLYRTTGAGGWAGSRKVGNGWSVMTAVFSPGDFSGDGAPDVLARNSSGDLLMYRGSGTGSWLGATRVGWGWNVLRQID